MKFVKIGRGNRWACGDYTIERVTQDYSITFVAKHAGVVIGRDAIKSEVERRCRLHTGRIAACRPEIDVRAAVS